MYRIRDTIKLYNPLACGQENVLIYQDTPGRDTFHVQNAWRGTIRNLGFVNGARQLNLGNPNIDQGLVRVEDCTFTDSSDFAIYMRKEGHSTHLVVQGCAFSNCGQVLHAICDLTTLRDCWITTAKMRNKAAIENHGVLVCEDILGVPIPGDNGRWIDNYHSLTCRNFRFGGEFGGMTPVYNFSPFNHQLGVPGGYERFVARAMGGAVILEGCWISAGIPGPPHVCAVYLNEIPNLLAIRNCALTAPAVIVHPRIKLGEYFKHLPSGKQPLPGMLRFDLQFNTGGFNNDPRTLALLRAARPWS